MACNRNYTRGDILPVREPSEGLEAKAHADIWQHDVQVRCQTISSQLHDFGEILPITYVRLSNTTTLSSFTTLRASLALFILAPLAFTSCSEPHAPAEYVILTGRIDTSGSPVERMYLHENKGLLGETLIDSAAVDSGGFAFRLADIPEGFYTLTSKAPEGGRSELYSGLYLMPTDSLSITYSGDETVYSGSSAKLQEFTPRLNEMLEEDSMYTDVYKRYYEIAQLEPDAASDLIEDIRKRQYEFFDSFLSGQAVPEKFESTKKIGFDLNAANQHYRFLTYHNVYTEDDWTYLEVDSGFYFFQDRIDLASDFSQQNFTFTSFLENHLKDSYTRLHGIYSSEKREAHRDTASQSQLIWNANWIKDNLSGINRDLGYHSLFQSQSYQMMILDSVERFYDEGERIFRDFESSHKTASIYEECKEDFDAYQSIKPGSLAPPLVLPDSSGNMVSLQDFKGSVVFIDFWGTWCGPCLASIPKHRELQAKFTEDEVVFLNVAMEYDEENIREWKQFLKENDFPGTHVVAEKQFHNEEIQPFKIGWAPTYVLIDQDGKIASPKAPSPGEAEDKIRALLADAL